MDIISLAVAKKFGQKANVFKYQGSCKFNELSTQGNEVGDVWNITDSFTLDGQRYDPGTNLAWDGEAWDALSASVDLSNYEEVTNKVTSLSAESTDTEYPSAKAVFDAIKDSGQIGEITRRESYTPSFIFTYSAIKKGLYLCPYPGTGLPHGLGYKINDSESEYKQIMDGYPLYVLITKSLDEITESTIIGTLYYIDRGTGYSDREGVLYTHSLYYDVSNKTIKLYGVPSYKWESIYFITRYNQQFYGVKNFSELPTSSGIPAQDNQLTNKKYVDNVVANIDISTATSAQIQALFSTEGGE